MLSYSTVELCYSEIMFYIKYQVCREFFHSQFLSSIILKLVKLVETVQR